MDTNEVKVKEQINEIEEKQKKLLYLVKFVRTHVDFSRTKDELDKHNIVSVRSDAGLFSKLGSSVKNKYESGQITKYQNQLTVVSRKLDSFDCKNHNEKYDEFKKITNELYKEKEDDISKLLLSIQIITENDEYFYKEESLDQVSLMLWNNAKFLSNLKDRFKKLYCQIANVGLSDTQKIALIGGGVILTAATCGLASAGIAFLGAGAVGGAAFTAGLATLGGSFGMAGGLGLLVAVGGVSLGAGALLTYGGLTTYNKQKIKQDFKKLSYNEVTQFLTIKYLQLEHASRIMTKDEFKNYINDTLVMTGDLKSESLFLALVEDQEVDKNSKLTDAYHRFDKTILNKFSNFK